MITLTTPAEINSVLGGNVPVAYDKLVLSSITFNTKTMDINSRISLTSSANTDMQEIQGNLTIIGATSTLEISVQQLDFYRRIALSGPQSAAVQTIIRNAQDALEGGLVGLGVIAGVQTTGA